MKMYIPARMQHQLRVYVLPPIPSRIDTHSQGFASPFFSSHSIERLLSNTLTTSSSSTKQDYKSLASIQSSSASSQLVDILITNTWPDSISQFSAVPTTGEGGADSGGAVPLDDVIRRIKPKYHFAACGSKPPIFWEREPYVWEDEPGGRIARFVSLGAFGGEAPPPSGKKQRVSFFCLFL